MVYNLGLFYHVTDPFKLMELTYALCNKFAVIDSIVHKEPVSAFIQFIDKQNHDHAEGKYVMELHPTYRL